MYIDQWHLVMNGGWYMIWLIDSDWIEYNELINHNQKWFKSNGDIETLNIIFRSTFISCSVSSLFNHIGWMIIDGWSHYDDDSYMIMNGWYDLI